MEKSYKKASWSLYGKKTNNILKYQSNAIGFSLKYTHTRSLLESRVKNDIGEMEIDGVWTSISQGRPRSSRGREAARLDIFTHKVADNSASAN